jgi:hypothetical protein
MKTTKTIQLTDEERNTIYNAIITTQNLYSDKRTGNETLDEFHTSQINQLESLLHKFITSKFDKES